MRDCGSRLGQWLAEAEIAPVKTVKKVAVIGSGPAGLAAAQQLARAGHDVTLRKIRQGRGLLRYGIPTSDGKHVIDRPRVQMEAEGVAFHYGVHVGGTSEGATIRANLAQYDAVALTGGAKPAAICRSPAATSTASILRWISCRNKIAASPRAARRTTRGDSPEGKHVV